MKKLFKKTDKNRILAAILIIALTLSTGSGFAFAQPGEGANGTDSPIVYFGYEMEDMDAGYLLFGYVDEDNQDAAEDSVKVKLNGEVFIDENALDDLDDAFFSAENSIPDFLSLTGYKYIDDSTIELEFQYDADAVDDEFLFGEAPKTIGEVAVYISPEAIADYNGEEVEVPIVVEVGIEGKIPFGPRLFRELKEEHEGMDGATVDVTANINDSIYYQHPNFYDVESGGSLSILSGFKTIQQATGFSCGLTSSLMVLEWFGEREKIYDEESDNEENSYRLHELDLAKLRGEGREYGGATTQRELMNVFDGLNEQYGQSWNYVSAYDLTKDMEVNVTGEPADDSEMTMDLSEAIIWYVKNGIPVIIGWQEWAGHYQVIIGYDDRGTEVTADDVLILADPFDTTDHLDDGYVIQSYERFIYDWSVKFDPDFDSYVFLAAWPEDYVPEEIGGNGIGIVDDSANNSAGIDKYGNLIRNLYDPNEESVGAVYRQKLADQIQEMRGQPPYNSDPKYIWAGEDGLSGPASSSAYRKGDYNLSPYYKHIDIFNLADGDGYDNSLQIVEGFETIQQATEFTCGVTAMLMVINSFVDDISDFTEIDLANLRDKTDSLPGTTVAEMVNVIANLNKAADESWQYITTYDLEAGKVTVGKGENKEELDYETIIPYFISKDIPVMVMWHEWGGHWQAVIGYDDMGTPDTQDDVLILADPYDTTDHNQDGYFIESFERLIYDWGNSYDSDVPRLAFTVMYPGPAVESPAKGSSYVSGSTLNISGTSNDAQVEVSLSYAESGVSIYSAMLDVENGKFSASVQLPRVSADTSLVLTAADSSDFEAVVNFTVKTQSSGGSSSGGGRGTGNNTDSGTDGGTSSDDGAKELTIDDFSDVNASQWFAQAVAFVLKEGLFFGTSDDQFSPDTEMTRAMFVTVLGRINGDLNGAGRSFSDVDSGSWYGPSVAWAAGNGIVNGTSDTTFAPNEPITREQMCVMIVNYASFAGIDLTPEVQAAAFSDAGQINSWAEKAVSICQQAGLVSGMGDGTFEPQGLATRAQVAVIFMNFYENFAAER